MPFVRLHPVRPASAALRVVLSLPEQWLPSPRESVPPALRPLPPHPPPLHLPPPHSAPHTPPATAGLSDSPSASSKEQHRPDRDSTIRHRIPTMALLPNPMPQCPTQSA